MRRLNFALIATLTFAGFSSVASAAGLPHKPRSTAQPTHNWSGCHVGLNAGYGWANADYEGAPNDNFIANAFPGVVSSIESTTASRMEPGGFTGGAGVGCNWQTGGILLGLETDFNYTDLNESTLRGPFPTTSSVPHSWEESVRSDYFGTLRGRLGITVAPAHLLYATGGLAYGDFQFSKTLDNPGFTGFRYAGSSSKTKLGWTIGAGYEMALSNAWTARIEYLYMDFGQLSVYAPQNFAGSRNGFSYSTRITSNVIRGGLNYKFSADPFN